MRYFDNPILVFIEIVLTSVSISRTISTSGASAFGVSTMNDFMSFISL